MMVLFQWKNGQPLTREMFVTAIKSGSGASGNDNSK